MAKMHASDGHRQHLGEKNALIDFDAVLLALQQRAFGIDLLARRRQAGHERSGVVSKFIDSREIWRDFW